MTLTATKKMRRARRLMAAREKVGDLFIHRTDFHWQRTMPDGTLLDFWPSTGKWMHNGVLHESDLNQLLTYIENGGV